MKQRLPLSSGVILQSRYRIVRQLGHGGMGVVYEAADERVRNRLVALKETYAETDEMRRAFEREAELLANTEHDAFPRVIDYFTEDEGCFLVMELIRGEDLAEMLAKRRHPFETEQVLKWADQILDALGDLHENHVIHRDIKPSNLKLTPKGRIKLLDFGIAKGLTSDSLAATTVGSMAAATLQYAPLEQVLRANPDWYLALSVSYPEKTNEILESGTDATSDLYALGATLYQLLTAQLPVNAPTRALSVWAGKGEKLRPAHEINSQVSPAVSDVLEKAMRLERKGRPSSASEMRQMLSEAANKKESFPDAVTLPLAAPISIPPKIEKPQPTETEQAQTEKTLPAFSTASQSVVTKLRETDAPETRKKNSGSSNSFLFWGAAGVLLFVLAGFAISVFIQTSSITGENESANPVSGGANLNLNSANTGTLIKDNINNSSTDLLNQENINNFPANKPAQKPQPSPAETNSNKTEANTSATPQPVVKEPKPPKIEDPPAKPKKTAPAPESRRKKQTQNPDCIFNGNC